MKISCVFQMVFIYSVYISSQRFIMVRANPQRRPMRSTRDRVQYRIVGLGTNPDCESKCERTRKRRSCGSDGRTYETICQAKRAKCLDPMLTTKPGKCKEAACVQARSYSLRKKQTRKSVFVPSCTADGRYAPLQCNNEVGFCWCATADGRMVAGSAVENAEPSCTTGNVRRSTESCSSSKKVTLLASIRSRSLREYRKATPLAEVPSSSNDLLRLALTWEFSNVDKNKNDDINPKEMRTFLKLLHSRECVAAMNDHCDSNTDHGITKEEWVQCLFSPSTTLPRQTSVLSTSSPSDILTVPHYTAHPTTASNCLLDDRLSLFEKIRSWILSESRQTDDDQIQPSERERVALSMKFTRLDKNKNNKLNSKEMKSLRRRFRKDNFKDCFQAVCDNNSDGNVEQSEWNACFVANKRRTCMEERTEALKLQRAQEGVYVPECAADNPRLFNEIQCHNGTGYCWCTSQKTGRPIPGTSTQGSLPNCVAAEPIRSAAALTIPGCKTPQAFINSLQAALLKLMTQKRRRSSNNEGALNSPSSFTPEVGNWYFSQIDANHDNLVSKREAKSFKKGLRRKVSPKKCIKKFMRFCDRNKNKKVTQTEFLSCIQISNGSSTNSQHPPSQLPMLREH